MKRLITIMALVGAFAPGCSCSDKKEGRHGKGGGADAQESVGKGEYEGIRTAKIDKGAVTVQLLEVGTLAPVAKLEVKSVLSGKVTELHVEAGDLVNEGDPMVTLEPGIDQLRELSVISNGAEKARIELNDASRDMENVKQLATKGFASTDQVKAAEKRVAQARIDHESAVSQRSALAAAGVPLGQKSRNLRSFNVVAPSAGVIMDRKVEIGEVASSGISGFNQGTVLFELADLKQLKVDLFVNEVDLAKIRVGMPATVSVDAFRGQNWKGEISQIAPQARAEGQIRGFDVEVKLLEAPGVLRPGMTANVDVVGDKVESVSRVPVESLFRKDGKDVVYLMDDGTPKATPVEVGLISLEWIEVKSGVNEGQSISLEDPARFLEDKKEDAGGGGGRRRH